VPVKFTVATPDLIPANFAEFVKLDVPDDCPEVRNKYNSCQAGSFKLLAGIAFGPNEDGGVNGSGDDFTTNEPDWSSIFTE